MVTVVIEEVGDTDSSMLSVAPSSISESDDPRSLLYLLDTAQEDQLDALLEDDVFATAMGQRMLAVSGQEVDDSLLSLGQLLLSRPSSSSLQAFRAQHPRRFTPYRQRGETYLLPQLRDWDLSEEHTTYHVLPGGYITAVGYAEEDEDNDKEEEEEDEEDEKEEDEEDEKEEYEEEEDEEDLILQDDDDYMDWLGEQLLNRKSGAPMWVIDAVHESPDDETAYTLWEASAFVS